MDKLIFNDSFSYGFEGLLATIADDPRVMRKCASAVVDQWGKIEPIKDHTLIHLIAVGAFEKTGANRNGDAFRTNVCRAMHDTFCKYGALYQDHKSDDYDKRSGDVVRSAFNEDMGRVELVVSCNNDKCANFLPDIEKGKSVAFSMGFKCSHDVCGVCDKCSKTRDEYCEHVKKNASAPYGMGRVLPDGRKCFVFNPKGYFNDISHVPVGAEPIAMDLRKVASLDGSETVIGGAELAEMYFLTNSEINSAKVAAARKCAEIEKRVEMIGQGLKTTRQRSTTRVKLSKTAMDEIRQAPPREMFGALAKMGAVLPLVDFYQAIFGPSFDEVAVAVRKTASIEPGAFNRLVSDPSRLAQVCRNSTYDPDMRGHLKLAASSAREVAAEYSIDPDLSVARACKHAALDPLNHEPVSVQPDFQSDYLLDQYCSYKVAALLAIDPSLSDTTILAAFL